MPRRIMLAKEKIDRHLDDAQKELQDDLGVGISEFTKLVAEVMEERSERYLLEKGKFDNPSLVGHQECPPPGKDRS